VGEQPQVADLACGHQVTVPAGTLVYPGWQGPRLTALCQVCGQRSNVLKFKTQGVMG
jgi:hypothetical protein